MYIPKSNLETDPALLYAFMREHNFAALVTQRDGHIDATHLPVMVDSERGVLRAHLARANDQWKSFDGSEALVMFQGAHAYISPSWYETHPSVPTWNYTAVHVYGVPVIREDDAEMRAMLRELVANHEQGRTPEWTMDLPEDYLHKMMQAIVGFELKIDRIEGKFKLSQNRSEVDQASVIAHLRESSDPLEVQTAEISAQRRANLNLTRS
ncbi:MAG: FMN-binding negative transcriptional regulator [Chloroflexi bacterium]|nr:FMN-binding negative transcriptional regulator [Chloroflexota bacterium]